MGLGYNKERFTSAATRESPYGHVYHFPFAEFWSRFIVHHNAKTALVIVTDDLLIASVLVLFNLSSAFDTINQNTLLQRLEDVTVLFCFCLVLSSSGFIFEKSLTFFLVFQVTCPSSRVRCLVSP